MIRVVGPKTPSPVCEEASSLYLAAICKEGSRLYLADQHSEKKVLPIFGASTYLILFHCQLWGQPPLYIASLFTDGRKKCGNVKITFLIR